MSATINLTVYLVKEEFEEHDEILNNRDDPLLRAHDVRIRGEIFGILYYRRVRRDHPDWVDYFEDAVDLTDRFDTATVAAVLITKKIDGRLFVIAFGQTGRYLLFDDVAEPRFGLKVVLNIVGVDRIRAISHKRIEPVARQTQEQLSQESGIHDFGLDVERDILRAVTARPEVEEELGTRITGRDALTFSSRRVPLRDLPDTLHRILARSREKTYLKKFEWIDQIDEVTDKGTVRELNEYLESLLSALDIDKVWLAPPETLRWEEVNGFRYRDTATAEVHDDLALEEYLGVYRLPDRITLNAIKHDRVWCVQEDGRPCGRWSIFKCLVAEVDLEEGTFVLNEGRWFRINNDFVAKINSFIDDLPPTKVDLPAHTEAGGEPAYNRAAAKASSSGLVLLDREIFKTGMPNERIEFCDLYGAGGVMVCVKPHDRSKALSHLWNQGVRAAESLLIHPMFREEVNVKLPATHKLPGSRDTVRASDYEVAYAVIGKPTRSLPIPFFSKVFLRRSALDLMQRGFSVTFTEIENRVAL